MSEIIDFRVNGAMLPQYIGRYIRVIAKVLNYQKGMTLIELSDGVQVQVKPKPNMTITSSFVEIVGKVEAANLIDPHNWYELKVEDQDKSMDIADKLVKLIHREDLRHLFYD